MGDVEKLPERKVDNDALVKALIEAERDARKQQDLETSRRLSVVEELVAKLGIRVRHAVGAVGVVMFFLTWYGADRILALIKLLRAP